MKDKVSIRSKNWNGIVRETSTWLLIVILMLVFLYSGTDKLLNFEKFQAGLSNSPLFPDGYSKLIALSIVGLLLLTSGVLLFGFWYPKLMKTGLYAYLTIMLLFTLYIIFILTLAKYVPCNCIGIADIGLSWQQHLWMNIIIVFFAGLTIWLYRMESLINELDKIASGKITMT